MERWASPWRTVGGRISCAIAPVEAYNGTLDAINADVTLSAEGMRQKRIAVHATLMQGIADAQHRYVEQPRAVREGRADVLLKRGAIARPTDPAERAAYGIRMAEVRAQLRAFDQLERDLLYVTASGSPRGGRGARPGDARVRPGG